MEENDKEMLLKWEKLNLSSDFIFGKVMQDTELCRELLQRIFPEMDIERVEYVETQKSINPDADAKGIRLDIFVRGDDGSAYVVEMQVADTKELPKRSRYYQSITDLQLLDKGIYYEELNQIFIVFICLFDLYGAGRHIYTFENICREDKSISMDDGATTIFLNAKGTMDDVSDELKAFLDYVAGKKTDDPYIDKLDDAVKKAKMNREWRREYMTLYMRDLENIRIGKEQEREQGVKILIETCQEFGKNRQETISKIQVKYAFSDAVAEQYMEKYWVG